MTQETPLTQRLQWKLDDFKKKGYSIFWSDFVEAAKDYIAIKETHDDLVAALDDCFYTAFNSFKEKGYADEIIENMGFVKRYRQVSNEAKAVRHD